MSFMCGNMVRSGSSLTPRFRIDRCKHLTTHIYDGTRQCRYVNGYVSKSCSNFQRCPVLYRICNVMCKNPQCSCNGCELLGVGGLPVLCCLHGAEWPKLSRVCEGSGGFHSCLYRVLEEQVMNAENT